MSAELRPALQPAATARLGAAESRLTAVEWQARAAEHRRRAERWTVPARERRSRGEPHPIEDFLFTYYQYPLSRLEDWHAPYGTELELTLESELALPACWRTPLYHRSGGSLVLDATALSDKERARLRWIRELLAATRDRPANLACHGLHEWAMVYRGEEVRHAATTALRLPQAEVDALVESRPIRCSHYDAFRFFHPAARPLNRLQPDLDSREHHEQPACIHANMDLYKWASKAMPWIGSGLLLDCFEMALELRDLDMRASPYELSAYGLTPVRIETPEGRREYEKEQARLAARTAPLRQRLIEALDAVLSSPRAGS